MLRFHTILLAYTLGAVIPNVHAEEGVFEHRSIWAEDEAVLGQALAIRAEALEQLTPFRFTDKAHFVVSLEYGVGGRGSSAAEYRPDTSSFHFPIHLTYRMNAEHKRSFKLIEPAVLAGDASLAKTLDHELGHALADQLSRKMLGKPFYTRAQFDAATREEQLGLNIISEGIGTYFEEVLHTKSNVSALAFPESLGNAPGYTYEMVAFSGGLWLVRDILNVYGEEGLVWLLEHPFVASDNLRKAAQTYREQSLRELALSPRHIEERRLQLQSLLTRAKELLRVTEHMGVLVAEERHGIPSVALAVMQTHTLPNDSSIRVVFVQRMLLAEAPDLLLEHIAMHETCHVVRGHTRSTRETEADTEQCVRNAVGDERYWAYIESFTSWKPHDTNLATAQAQALTFLRATKDNP